MVEPTASASPVTAPVNTPGAEESSWWDAVSEHLFGSDKPEPVAQPAPITLPLSTALNLPVGITSQAVKEAEIIHSMLNSDYNSVFMVDPWGAKTAALKEQSILAEQVVDDAKEAALTSELSKTAGYLDKASQADKDTYAAALAANNTAAMTRKTAQAAYNEDQTPANSDTLAKSNAAFESARNDLYAIATKINMNATAIQETSMTTTPIAARPTAPVAASAPQATPFAPPANQPIEIPEQITSGAIVDAGVQMASVLDKMKALPAAATEQERVTLAKEAFQIIRKGLQAEVDAAMRLDGDAQPFRQPMSPEATQKEAKINEVNVAFNELNTAITAAGDNTVKPTIEDPIGLDPTIKEKMVTYDKKLQNWWDASRQTIVNAQSSSTKPGPAAPAQDAGTPLVPPPLVGTQSPILPPPPPGPQFIEVKKGTNLTRIAEKYGVKIQDIVDANPNKFQHRSRDLIYAGEYLQIPLTQNASVTPQYSPVTQSAMPAQASLRQAATTNIDMPPPPPGLYVNTPEVSTQSQAGMHSYGAESRQAPATKDKTYIA